MNRSRLFTIAVGAAILIALCWAVDHYRSNAIMYKEQRDKASTKLNQANATISDMQVRQRDAGALDAKYTGELADAKRTIEDLQRDVATGKRRLQLNATCPKGITATTGSLGDASTARLNPDAERDYFRLRAGIETVTGQINYLQGYIRQQCQK